jgi:hypothetical protein
VRQILASEMLGSDMVSWILSVGCSLPWYTRAQDTHSRYLLLAPSELVFDLSGMFHMQSLQESCFPRSLKGGNLAAARVCIIGAARARRRSCLLK